MMVQGGRGSLLHSARGEWGGEMRQIVGARDESQWIVGNPTLTRTIPRPKLSRLQKICVENNSKLLFRVQGFAYLLGPAPRFANLGIAPYCFSFIIQVTLLSSTVSDLEAFSHNPTDGSFTALAFQPTVLTNYLIQRFLSY